MDLPEVAVLEDIYAPNLKSNLPHPHVSPAEKETHVYYLAYGSNMYGFVHFPSGILLTLCAGRPLHS